MKSRDNVFIISSTYFISPYPNFIGMNPVSVIRKRCESKGGGRVENW